MTDLALLSIDDSRWAEFARGAGTSFFHHPIWAKLVADCYGYTPLVAALLDDLGRPLAGIPLVEVRVPFAGRRWVSLPFTDHCAPIGAETELARALADEARRRSVAGIEIRASLAPTAGLAESTVAVRHVITLRGGAGAQRAALSAMHQRNIRKAERSGVTVARGTSPDDLAWFYRLHLETRRRHGVPTQPARFFRLLQERVIAAGHGFVLTASCRGRPVAAAVFLVANGTLTYKYGASDARFWAERPNNLLFWSAIEWACATGQRSLDLGRSDLEDAGLRSFKDGWGATEEPLVYSSTRPIAPSRGLTRRALGGVIRRTHPWVSRAIGELLYRYAA